MKIKISLVLFFISFGILSQNGKPFFEINYNTFSHSSLSNFQQEFKNDNPEIPTKITDDFPSNLGFTMGYEFTNINVAPFISYNSTGGKLSYSDFSGTLRVEQSLNALTIGGIYYFKINSIKNLGLGLKAFSMISNLNLSSYYKISDEITEENIEFKSIDIGIGIQMNYEFPITFFNLRTNIGYDLVIPGQLKFKENSDFHLINNSDKDVKAGWSGLRIGIGISIPIK